MKDAKMNTLVDNIANGYSELRLHAFSVGAQSPNLNWFFTYAKLKFLAKFESSGLNRLPVISTGKWSSIGIY